MPKILWHGGIWSHEKVQVGPNGSGNFTEFISQRFGLFLGSTN